MCTNPFNPRFYHKRHQTGDLPPLMLGSQGHYPDVCLQVQ